MKALLKKALFLRTATLHRTCRDGGLYVYCCWLSQCQLSIFREHRLQNPMEARATAFPRFLRLHEVEDGAQSTEAVQSASRKEVNAFDHPDERVGAEASSSPTQGNASPRANDAPTIQFLREDLAEDLSS
ncbi:unnamed protein product [Symbiodinium sp. CCMP2592]|nr:unnamed protein product [Symbiodinium sp. CCMP2592]